MISSNFIYRDVNAEKGGYYTTDVDYPALMRKHIAKHVTSLQPIFEAVSNSFEATKNEEDNITISLNFSQPGFAGVRTLLSISIADTGHGIKNEDLCRIQRLFDDSKGYNNFGSGRIQYLHYFDKTDIHTVYEENGKRYKRRLVMSMNFYKLNHSVLWVGEPEEVDSIMKTGTVVTFYRLLSEDDQVYYNELTTTGLKEIIWNHYLGRLCIHTPNCAELHFKEYIDSIHNELANCYITNADIPKHECLSTFNVKYTKLDRSGKLVKMAKHEEFTLQSFKLPLKIQKSNEVLVMSKGESVGNSGLHFPLVVNSPKVDECYRLFLLSSDFLTRKDTDLRGNLNLLSSDKLKKEKNIFNEEPEDILIEDIEKGTIDKISEYYIGIKNSKEDAENRLHELITRYSFDEATVNTLVKDPSVPAITVFKEVFCKQAEDKAKTYDALNKVYDSLVELNPEDKCFAKLLTEKINKVSDLIPEINKMELLNYTTKRKVVLLLFEDILKKRLLVQNKKGKKTGRNTDNSETLLHHVIFPKKSNDTINSNLWIINEDFIHFNGVSESEIGALTYNDKEILRDDLTETELKQLNEYRNQLGKRPDIFLFPEERKCIIIELKSLSVDITKHLSQVKTYASLLREFAKEEFLIDEFYCYLFGEDFSFEEVRRAEADFNEDFTHNFLYYEKPNGVYGGPNRTNAKIRYEIYKYSTLLEKATLRNKIFTDKISVDLNTDGNKIL